MTARHAEHHGALSAALRAALNQDSKIILITLGYLECSMASSNEFADL